MLIRRPLGKIDNAVSAAPDLTIKPIFAAVNAFFGFFRHIHNHTLFPVHTINGHYLESSPNIVFT